VLKDCLASGWSAPVTWEYLERRYGAEGLPSIKAIVRWRSRQMGTAKILPHKLITQQLKGIDYKVDCLGHLSRLIYAMEHRIGLAIEAEKTFNLPSQTTDRVVSTFLDTMREYIKLAQDMGIVPAPAPPVFDLRTQNLNVTPEALEKLKEVVARIRQIKAEEEKELEVGSSR